MKVLKLADFSIVISRGFIFGATLVFCLAVMMISGLYWHDVNEQAQYEARQVDFSNQLLQSNVSEQLSIIANSTVFLDFLRSGPVTRKLMEAEFRSILLPLKSTFIEGMQFLNHSGETLFQSGQTSRHYVVLSLCYLNNRLNNDYGSCDYRWVLYINKKLYLHELNAVNTHIRQCKGKSCYASSVVDKKFGSFPVASKSAFQFKVSFSGTRPLWLYLVFAMILFFSVVSFAVWMRLKLNSLVNGKLIKPIHNISQRLQSEDILPKTEIRELNELVDRITLWRSRFIQSQAREKAAQLSEVAAQVAHDLNNYLFSLGACLQQESGLSQGGRERVGKLMYDINAMSEQLLAKHKSKLSVGALSQEEPITKPLPTMILAELIVIALSVLELKAEMRGVMLRFSLSREHYFLCGQVDTQSFKRTLINLVNNALEASPRGSHVEVKLEGGSEKLLIEIKDQGEGIDPGTLKKLGKEEISSSKEKGNGMGVFNAVKSINSWGGEVKFESKAGQGTIVRVFLPKAAPPSWHVMAIPVKNKVYILDDSENIHAIWREKFKECDIELMHFTDPIQFIRWFTPELLEEPSLFLIDYHFTGHDLTGLEIIDTLNLYHHSILVTGATENEKVQEFCSEGKLKLLPKGVLAIAPLSSSG